MTPSQERAPQDIEHALYEALKAYERGDLSGERVAVGILPAPLSAVFLRVEKAIEAKLLAHGLAERRAGAEEMRGAIRDHMTKIIRATEGLAATEGLPANIKAGLIEGLSDIAAQIAALALPGDDHE